MGTPTAHLLVVVVMTMVTGIQMMLLITLTMAVVTVRSMMTTVI